MANKRRRSSASSTSPAGAPPHASTGISRKTTDEDETSVGDTALLEGRAFAAASSPSHLSRLIGHQEIFLRVLGFLSASDLASAQGVNRYWQHMSLDPQVSHRSLEHLCCDEGYWDRYGSCSSTTYLFFSMLGDVPSIAVETIVSM